MKHQKEPISRDMHGDWEHVVIWSYLTLRFVRFLDRNGEHSEPVVIP